MSTLQLTMSSSALESLSTLPSQNPSTTALPATTTTQEATASAQIPLIVNVPAFSENSGNLSHAEAIVEQIESQKVTLENDKLDVTYDDDGDDDEETYDDYEEVVEGTRAKRAAEESPEVWGKLIPGACVKGCAIGFYAFSLVSAIVNCLGSSGRIGNLLVNYRCVSKQDKSVTQGLILMLISLFALIPGPIMFGRIIDSTCLVWTEQCSGRRGNCQLYDQRRFRYYINLTAFALTSIGVIFDFLVWKLGKNLDLYGEREEEMLKKEKELKLMRNGHS